MTRQLATFTFVPADPFDPVDPCYTLDQNDCWSVQDTTGYGGGYQIHEIDGHADGLVLISHASFHDLEAALRETARLAGYSYGPVGKDNLTPAEMFELSEFAAWHGERWKMHLLSQWQDKKSSRILMRLKESHGPAWLNDFRLSQDNHCG